MGNKSIMAVVLLLAVAGGGFFFGGFYGVGADDPHWAITEGVLAEVREASIAREAQSVEVPQGLDSEERISKGAGNYQAMCAGCHLAPGQESSELFAGLYPQPPRFALQDSVESQRSFWVIKHGLKMSGMPAWGLSNTDDDIWSLVAFLRAMPKMDGERYRTLVVSSDGHTHGGEAADAHSGAAHHQEVPQGGHETTEGHHAGEASTAPVVEEQEVKVNDHYADGHSH